MQDVFDQALAEAPAEQPSGDIWDQALESKGDIWDEALAGVPEPNPVDKALEHTKNETNLGRARAFVEGAGIPTSVEGVKELGKFLIRSPVQDVKDIYQGVTELPGKIANIGQTISESPVAKVVRDPLSEESFGTYGTVVGMVAGPKVAEIVKSKFVGEKGKPATEPVARPDEAPATPASPVEQVQPEVTVEPRKGIVEGELEAPAPIEPLLSPETGQPIPRNAIGVTDAIAEIERRNAPEPVKVQTGIKNEIVDVERDARSLPPAIEEAKRDFGTVWDEAMQKPESETIRLIEELKENPRAVSDVENATVLRKQIEVQAEFDKAANDLIIANGTGDIVRAAELDTTLAKLSDDLLGIYDIDKSIGRETARGLNARKMLAAEDFSLSKMVLRKRAARGGEELTPQEIGDLGKQSKEIATLESKIRERELSTHFKELIESSKVEAMQAKAAKRTITDFLGEQANKARERIKERGSRLTTGIDPVDLADHAIIGADYIAKGLTEVGKWSSEMIRDFGETIKPYLSELYKRAKELHAANAGVFTDKRMEMAKKRTTKRIDELQGKIKQGDFSKKQRVPLEPDKELGDLQFKLSKVKEDFLRGVFQDQLKQRSGGAKTADAVREIMNTSRALKTSLDLSGVLRQGGLVVFGHPVRGLKSLPSMFKAFASEKGQFKVMQQINNRPNAPRYARSKLYIADPHTTSLAKMEEAYMSRWADKIPLVSHSQRAYVTFLNELRANSFDALADNLAKKGKATAAEDRVIANYVNVATGRGTLDGLSKAAVGLNTIFFAPRYVASRFEYLAGQPLYKGTANTRTLIAKEYARTLAGLGVVYTLANMAGGEVETDSRSSDFGKVRFGNTRIDPLAGLSQTSVILSRVGSGEMKKGTGEIVPIRGQGVPFGGKNTADTIASFLRTKLAPIPSAGLNVVTGKNVVGQPVTPESTASDLLTPLAFSDIYAAMQEQGIDRGTAMGLLSIFGMGLQSYPARPSSTKKPSMTPPKMLP